MSFSFLDFLMLCLQKIQVTLDGFLLKDLHEHFYRFLELVET